MAAPVETEAAPALFRPDYPERYVVQRGDTLWDISERFLRDPWRWPEVWHINPQVHNPHLIYPGDVIVMTWLDGKPVLEVQRGLPSVLLTPTARVETLDRAIPTIPLDAIGPFLNRPWVVGANELDAAPYLVAMSEQRLMAGTGVQVYARGFRSELDSNYVVLRRGQVYRNPDNRRDILGYEAIYVSEATLEREGDPATLVLTRAKRESLAGDRLLPLESEPPQPHFLPRAPSQAVNGRILAVVDGVSRIGQYHVVALSVGARDGVEPGHVLAVYQAGAKVRDPQTRRTVTLPEERAGTLMVFRTFERVSYGLIMTSSRPMEILDRVTNP